MKNFKKFLAMALIGSLGILGLAGCTGEEEEASDDTVQIGYVDWAEGVAMTNLAKVALEDKMGYEVETTMADPGMIFTSLAEGDMDFFLDAWLPVTHEEYMERYGDKLDKVGINYENARIGLVVPDYVDIDSIDELNANVDKFDGRIVGIGSGAGIMNSTNTAIEDYDLDYDLLASSEIGMTSELQTAIENEEWIAVTGWTPHWKFTRWDLKFLEDPKGTYGEAETLYTVGRLGNAEDLPEVNEFLENFYMTEEELGSLMGALADSEDNEDAARQWMEENEELVDGWIPAE